MKKIVLLVTIVLVLTGCEKSVEQTETIKQADIQEPEKPSYFQKNIQCNNYKKGLVKEWNEERIETNETHSTEITAVFYSPKLDTCLFMLQSSDTFGKQKEANMYYAELHNIFTGERVDYVNTSSEDGETATESLMRSVKFIDDVADMIKNYQ